MPQYEYHCQANDRYVDVMQGIKDPPFKTWGELCKGAQLDPGDTPPDAPVTKVLHAPNRHGSWSQWRAL